MLGAVIVHPNKKFVIPFAPEAITKQDGAPLQMIVNVMHQKGS